MIQLQQCKPTKARKSSELQHYNTSTPKCFGPQWPVSWTKQLFNFFSSPVCSRTVIRSTCDFMADGFVHSTCNSLLVCTFWRYNLLWTHSNQQAALITVHKSIYPKITCWLTFRHRASCILGQVFHYSPESAFYIFNQQIHFIIWYLLDRTSLI